jgi:single-strand DNA-binding protein
VPQNINVVVITGNLTQDPELRHLGSGTAVCELRVAVNGRRKDGDTEEWVDKPNYFNVTVFGKHGQSCADHLAKGRPVAIDGRLDWREWEAKDGSGKRQAVQIIADNVQFLGGKPTDGDSASATDSQDEDRQPAGVGAGGGDDDIPF